jgi:metallophosphoesterase (TIGR03767 family)
MNLRTELASGTPGGAALLTLAHLSDVHVCDHQSPARVEFLDRWADPDSPLLEALGEVGTYRPQDMLTAHVADATVRAVNALGAAPAGGAPIDLAIVNGDNTDNGQANELGWYIRLLEGGLVHPDSGDLSRYEGVADDVHFDERFWHPSSERPDLPRSRWGLPTVPGLLDAVRAPFEAAGLDLPWLAVHGNHDRLLQGTLPGSPAMTYAATGRAKPIAVPADWTADAVLRLLAGLEACEPAALVALAQAQTRTVTPDRARRIVGPGEFAAAHFGPAARPPGHGFTEGAGLYYRYDHGPVSVLAMDTVNPHGNWQGSLDEVQLAWLADELTAADADHRYVVLASHHPLDTLTNARTDGADRRVLTAELAAVLAGHPSLILWLNGHTHRTAVTPHGSYWEVTAPSLIDWPQQGRIVEILRADGRLTIAASRLDHAGETPWTGATDTTCALAGLSRRLAEADWQGGADGSGPRYREGLAADRDVALLLADPWA